jgi:hypothetical protein
LVLILNRPLSLPSPKTPLRQHGDSQLDEQTKES